MGSQRLDKWKKPIYLPLSLTGDLDDELNEFLKKRAKTPNTGTINKIELGFEAFVYLSKELIFDLVDQKPTFHIVMYSIDTETFSIILSDALDVVKLETENDIKRILVYAKLLDVPVYPNTEELAPLLQKYYYELLTDGFLYEIEEGKESRLKFTNSIIDKIGNTKFFEDLEFTETYLPTDLMVIRNAFINEFSKRDEATKVLTYLRIAIKELEENLSSKTRNENSIQNCLTKYPILFGPEYVKIIPKHQLGSEYEMDFALQRVSGLFDLAEIESSNLELFTKKGNPRKELIHAEQQILDWLSWIEHHHSYAIEKLPNLQHPIGYVIMGRSDSLSKEDRKRLNRRNIVFKGAIQIMTYDDLLKRAKNLLNLLLSGVYK